MPVLVCATLTGCVVKTLPEGASVVERLDVIGAEQVDADDVEAKIATAETRRLLGGTLAGVPVLGVLDSLSVEYGVFDRYVLQRDLERVRRYYRSRGFYDAEVRAGRVIELESGAVRVEVVVAEGEPVRVGDVALDWPGWRESFEAMAELQEAIDAFRALPRFDEQEYERLKARLRRSLTERGYAHAAVRGQVHVDLVRHVATVRLLAQSGPRCTFGPITIQGLGPIPEGPVRRALGFEPGEPYSSAKIEAAHLALGDLGVFASAQIAAELGKQGAKQRSVIPISVLLEPSKLRRVKLGVGAELGSQLGSHAVLGWEHRNLLGGLRRLAAELRPALVFFPTRAETLFEQPPTRVLPEARLDLHFVQPGLPEARSNVLLDAGTQIYAPTSISVPAKVGDDFNIVGYRELDGSFGLERPFYVRLPEATKLYVGQFIKLRFDDPFSYNQPDIPAGYERVLIPHLETVLWWDLRRGESGEPDPVSPRRGFYLGTNLQLAGGFLGGDADDVRLRPELRAYAPVTKKLTLALRATVGLLFPRSYGDTLTEPPAAQPTAQQARDLQILSFRALYSGGPGSNRGYGYREVGPHARLPFLSQRGPSAELLPSGGLGLWELSTELRFPLSAKLRGALFIDAGDVTRSSDGFLQRLGEPVLEPEEGGPAGGRDDELPVAVSLAIGEAY
ncbi:MAG: BamA/TamA family outer membrane protein [Deltaproteobacteria bacterium]|nr:BamA/TamA family outer membrane protein [Deltaproteobacteria bacterium]